MAKSYAEQLKHGSWQERRLRIMERDNFCCVQCKSKERLQVHHKVYKPNRFAWQYPDKDLETLCDPCHYREHFEKPIAPAKVWEGIEDNVIKSHTQLTIMKLQDKLRVATSEDLQFDILRHIVFLQKGGVRG